MDAKAWLAVQALPGVGATRVAQLVARRLPWPQGWLAALPSSAASALRLWLAQPARSPLQRAVDDTVAWQQQAPRRYLLHRDHPHWPRLLDQLPDPPVVLWAQGDLRALDAPGMAMVGTRRPTSEGSRNAQAFARELAGRGWCVVSGMALGVDGVAQSAALQAGGCSIAVLGSGIDVIYPARHRDLYEQLSTLPGGLVVSEHPPGTVARPAFFPRRNRIVTGLALGTLVVEATEKSGSLVSARLALEQGRELFALPGSLHNVQARGCLQLLRSGATLVRHVDDMLEELQQWAPHYHALSWAERTDAAAPQPDAHPPGSADPLLDALGASPTPIDLLVNATGLSVSDCQQRLLMLELEGQVAQQAGGWVRVTPPW